MAGRIYHLLTKEAAYGPNHHHINDFRAAQQLEKSLDLDDRFPAASPLPRQLGGAVRKESI
jgi:hypothetical protein